MTDFCAVKGLLPYEEALELLLDNIEPTKQTKSLLIEEALNFVLATDIASPINVPPHDNSAMDGYAFAHSSLAGSNTLKLAGKAFAGQPFDGKCGEGECIRIMTGAKLPDGCDSVEMQERCEVNGEQITFTAEKRVGDNVRNCGEDIQASQLVLSKGHRLTAVDIGLLASLGVPRVEVYQPIKVAIIATGDELKTPGEILGEGDIYESNRYGLSSLLKKLNVDIIDFGVIEDDFDAIKHAFEKADEQADIVISSGGVSVGEADYTKDVLDSLGRVGFWKLAIKPGKPFAFGKLKNSVFFGLPGNPVSALVTMYQLAIPGIIKMQNSQPLTRIRMKVKTVTDLRKSPGRKDFQRGVFSVNKAGQPQVTSTGAQGSGILSSLGKANCFIVLSAEKGRVDAGEYVEIELFDSTLQ